MKCTDAVHLFMHILLFNYSEKHNFQILILSDIDIDCLLHTLAQEFSNCHFFGICKEANIFETSSGYTLFSKNNACLPFADESFDLVVSLECYENMNSQEKSFKEILRILKFEGKCFFAFPVFIDETRNFCNFFNKQSDSFLCSPKALSTFQFQQALLNIYDYFFNSTIEAKMLCDDPLTVSNDFFFNCFVLDAITQSKQLRCLYFKTSFICINTSSSDHPATIKLVNSMCFEKYNRSKTQHFSEFQVLESHVSQYEFLPDLTGKRVAEGGKRFATEVQKSTKKSEVPLVSVITTVFNGEFSLEQAIKSVFEQTYPRIEYIIIDADSKDSTLQIIQKSGHLIEYFISEPDNGIYEGMNKGLQVAQGDYMILLNADDFFVIDALEHMVKKAINFTADIVAGHAIFLDENDTMVDRVRSHWGPSVYISSPLRHEAMLVSRECYVALGLYNTDFQVVSDRLWMIKAYESGAHVEIYENDVLYFRQSGLSSKAKGLHELESARVLKSIDQSLDADFISDLSFAWKLSTKQLEFYFNSISSLKLKEALKYQHERMKSRTCCNVILSVQVPVYNASKTLESCLQALLDQTFQQFEVICVDDGSQDESLEIMRRFAAKDSRIQVFEHVSNKRTLQTRKTALQKARGQYVAFVDADDIPHPGFLKELYDKAIADKLDLVQCLAEVHDLGNFLDPLILKRYNSYFSSCLQTQLKGRTIFEAFPSAVKSNLGVSLIHRSVFSRVVHYIPDDPLPHGNDTYLMFLMSYFATSFACLQKVLYTYSINSFSDFFTIFDVASAKQYIQSKASSLQMCKKFIQDVGDVWDRSQKPFHAVEIYSVKSSAELAQRVIQQQPHAKKSLLNHFEKYFGKDMLQYLSDLVD